MGYYIRLRQADFSIDADKAADALEKINKELDENYSSLDDAFYKYGRWEIRKESEEYVIATFVGEKHGFGEEELLEIVAEFVDDGSFVEMSGEDGELWRYTFKNGEMDEIHPEITWDMERGE